ncbi:PLP-dependent aminotransferase family protein [Hoeflea prorocentri]|uniref:PLP-dependent aminotransferase family protein n=1 Tax=Hoeflea prorocentri TaxID=1922333 RepID=A0A9X3UJE2_9HYPH|nr:PLP-dependent aminotransferase family protein [Hoeflea prorocentri]MCY6381895.1 PLP-dependent aminotransferase family protein [Hoeflea prorocentri]MDA5399695.1 PLP-dependent aminotransferase family protein [Hoeflea prorocentri]
MMGELVNTHRLTRLLGSWEDSDGTLSNNLASGLRLLIENGQLPAGCRLPSERQLAATMGLARTTVGAAFDELRDDGSLNSRAGIGTFVSSAGRTAGARGDARLQSFLERRIMGRVDLRSAAGQALPMVAEELGRLSAADFEPLLGNHGYYPKGLPALREAIAQYYVADGLATSAREVMVTAGAQQAVHIITRSLIEAGDVIVVEEPTYRGGIESLRAAGARLVSVKSGDEGLDVGFFADALERHRPKMALILSTVHNPTGSCLENDKRLEIASLAGEYNVTIIDDASTADTLCRDNRPLPIAGFCSNTITIGSASKLFWGGLRIGWIRAQADVLSSLVAAKSAEDLGTSIPSQIATERLLRRVPEARCLRRALLEDRLTEVLARLAYLLPDWHVHPNQGGASLWIQLPKGRSALAFAEQARRAGVDLLAGPTFSISNECDNHLRLAISAPREKLETGLQRLAHVWNSWAR